MHSFMKYYFKYSICNKINSKNMDNILSHINSHNTPIKAKLPTDYSKSSISFYQ